MSPQQEFLRYLGVTGATIFGLFALQHLWATAMDVHWHDELKEHGPNPELVELRDEESKALESTRINKAMSEVARSRTAAPLIAPKSSDDLSAMSGWVQNPDFAPYEPNVVSASPDASGKGQ